MVRAETEEAECVYIEKRYYVVFIAEVKIFGVRVLVL